MKIKAQKLLYTDTWDRPLAQDENGAMYCDVSCGMGGFAESWHTTTPEGEPCVPVELETTEASTKA